MQRYLKKMFCKFVLPIKMCYPADMELLAVRIRIF